LLGLLSELLRSKLLLLLECRLLLESRLLLSKLLLLRNKLLLLLRSKLLLLSELLLLRSKLLLLRGKLLRLLLLLLELLEVKVEVLSVKLFIQRGLGIESSSIEDRPSWSTPLVGKCPSSCLVIPLSSNSSLSLNHSGLMSNYGSMSLLFQLKLRALSNRGSSRTHRASKVRGKASAIVGGIRDNLQLSRLIQKAIFTFDIPFFIPCL